MGINFSHGGAHWSYSGFHSFRERLAAHIGIRLIDMQGFDSLSCGLPWPDPTTDPIIFLLDHSDCDGELSPEQCAVIAPRLRELVSGWPEGDYDKRMGAKLADGMDEAASEKSPLIFR